jgi:hypothetical protein
MRRVVLVGLSLVAVVLAATAFAGQSRREVAKAARGPGLTPMQQRLVSGTASRALELNTAPALTPRVHNMRKATRASSGVGATMATGCPVDRTTNIRVNQNCQNLSDPDLAGRGQAQNETAIAQDPNHPSRMVASSNDYRRGDGSCYSYYSADGGRSWTDSTPPMSFTRGTNFGGFGRQYWQAGGDTSVAWDTKGNAYLSCQMFNRGQPTSQNPDMSSAFYVFRSTGSGGAGWNFPGRPVAEANTGAGGTTLLDKQYLTVDDTVGSPYQDRLYVTWTLYAPDGTAYLYEAYSRDYGEHFSSPKLVSANSPACVDDLGAATPQGACNTNSFSQPFTGPDGTLYVVWSNYNVTGAGARGDDDSGGGDGGATRNAAPAAGIDNRNQVLLAKSTDGGNTFSTPVKVADFYELPDCATYQEGQNPGRSCVPEKGETANSVFRAANYPSGAVNPRNPREIDVTFASYINRHSNEANGCVPQGYNADTLLPLYDGVKTAGACNNDVLVSRSTDAGASFTGTTADVRKLPSVRAGQADQYWQWAAFDRQGRLVVSYYDRAYGGDEQTGYSDVTLSGSRDASTFASARVTSGPMPPASQFGGLFFGDYSGLSAGDVAHPIWMDTRDPELFTCRDSAGNVITPPSVCTASATNAAVANDQNIYTRRLAVPLP